MDERGATNLIKKMVKAVQTAHIITLDFSGLKFIEPVGMASLASISKYISIHRPLTFIGLERDAPALRYLDYAGLNLQLRGKRIWPSSPNNGISDSTIPLNFFYDGNYHSHLYQDLIPWLQRLLNLPPHVASNIRSILEELYLNIRHHSGVRSGCAIAQYFSKTNKIKFAISDWGRGIPDRVRSFTQRNYDDKTCITKACENGFSTKSDTGNRGYGLHHLINYCVKNNGGRVMIRSEMGQVVVTQGTIDPPNPRYESKQLASDFRYPGTLIHVELCTDTLPRYGNQDSEDLEWD